MALLERHSARTGHARAVLGVQDFAQSVRHSAQDRSKFRATYQRTTKKGERMAWLTLADGTAAIECSLFPNAYERLGQTGQAQSSLREGAFLVARGRVAQQEATGSKLFIDDIVNL